MRSLIHGCDTFDLLHVSLQRSLGRSVGEILLLALLCGAGCSKAPAPPADLATTPWLDPQAQISSLKQGDPRIRGGAARNLGEMGAKAAGALPDLERLAREDPEANVRKRAQEAAEKIRAAKN